MKVFAILFAIFVAAVSANQGYGGHSSGGYGGHGGYAPVHGQQVLSYGVHPPKVQCGSSILVGCAPQVAKVRYSLIKKIDSDI